MPVEALQALTAAEMTTPYPPGAPAILPGEVITRECSTTCATDAPPGWNCLTRPTPS
ncbi:hypothetical protein ABZX92_27165 [Lentzea sp. NPDC006480]|uniref:Orn/Lys/Arg family decarboxylase n=1 Tax=Lentzea sp. NPDC006480 TaxID=3157176 RepID=UPI0033B3BBE4